MDNVMPIPEKEASQMVSLMEAVEMLDNVMLRGHTFIKFLCDSREPIVLSEKDLAGIHAIFTSLNKDLEAVKEVLHEIQG